MEKGMTELVFILDKSGSMSGLERDTIGGYNSLLAKQRDVEGDCRITTVLFDHGYELLHDRIDIQAVTDLTEKEYQVGGSTALLDAVGMTIHKIDKVQKYTVGGHQPNTVMFVIITDGEENASREYSAKMVKGMIELQKLEFEWEFVFLGANIDAVATAGQFGIAPDRAVDYLADREGTQLNYAAMSEAVTTFREEGVFDDTHFDTIRDDVKRRGGR